MKDLRFQQLFVEQLRDFYWAENQIAKFLPEMVDAANSRELKNVLNNHRDVTKKQAHRLERVLENLGISAEGQAGPAAKGLLQEGKQIIASTNSDSKVRDAALIIAARKIEHYEIASYGSLLTLADQMQDTETVDLLNESDKVSPPTPI